MTRPDLLLWKQKSGTVQVSVLNRHDGNFANHVVCTVNSSMGEKKKSLCAVLVPMSFPVPILALVEVLKAMYLCDITIFLSTCISC